MIYNLILFSLAACHRKAKVSKNSDTGSLIDLYNDDLKESSLDLTDNAKNCNLSPNNTVYEPQKKRLSILEKLLLSTDSNFKNEHNSVAISDKKNFASGNMQSSCINATSKTTVTNPMVFSDCDFNKTDKNLHFEITSLGNKTSIKTKITPGSAIPPNEVIQDILLIQKQAALQISKWNENHCSTNSNSQEIKNSGIIDDENDIKSHGLKHSGDKASSMSKSEMNKIEFKTNSKKSKNANTISEPEFSSCLEDKDSSSSQQDLFLETHESPMKSKADNSIYKKRVNRIKFKISNMLIEIEEKFELKMFDKNLDHELLKNFIFKIAAIYLGLYSNFFHFNNSPFRREQLYFKMLKHVKEENFEGYSFSTASEFLIICRKYKNNLTKCLNFFPILGTDEGKKDSETIEFLDQIDEFYNELNKKYKEKTS